MLEDCDGDADLWIKTFDSTRHKWPVEDAEL